MKKFLLHLYVSIMLWKLGYNFSKLTSDHGRWGFYRLNFEKGDLAEYAIVDIDFSYGEGEGHDFSVVHAFHDGNITLHRYNA